MKCREILQRSEKHDFPGAQWRTPHFISFYIFLRYSWSTAANPNGWLTDSEVHASQQLLKTNFPYIYGLDDPVILSGDLVDPCVSEFVQISNTSNHWVGLSTIGCGNGLVKIYDSLNTSPSAAPVTNSCQVLFHQGKEALVANQKVQCQKGSGDCGLFAIAFVTSLCFGDDLQDI